MPRISPASAVEINSDRALDDVFVVVLFAIPQTILSDEKYSVKRKLFS
jgi:hypothetical protein